MDTDPELRRRADEVLKATKEAYGFIPVVNQVLSERPDMFLPAAEYAHAVLEGDGALEQKQRYLSFVFLQHPDTPFSAFRLQNIIILMKHFIQNCPVYFRIIYNQNTLT